MEGKRSNKNEEEIGEIKKGPWKVDEDEVLINHVKRYGPKDWSSIRSKGLLHRTGKSCRLRWVNKLRPNLKNGVKFSAEEERIVIELQGQFGNKWARIATYLPGRTDNDVKNFWSSRQKRLARILQTPSSSTTPSKSHKTSTRPVVVEAPKFRSSTEESSSSSSKSQSCLSLQIDSSEMIKMVALPDLVNPDLLNFEQNLLQLEFIEDPSDESKPQVTFPVIPPLQTDFPISLENHALDPRFADPDFLELPFVQPSFGYEGNCSQTGGRREKDNLMNPDSLFDDFPIDMFDHMEAFPSPWEC